MSNQTPFFLIHSVNSTSRTMLIEVNERVLNDILESINERLQKTEVYVDQKPQGDRLKLIRDEIHKRLPELNKT